MKPQKTVLQKDEYISVVSFSKHDNGSYLAAATTKGNIFVWQLSSGKVILETKSTAEREYGICSIDYSSIDSTEAAFIDCYGYWGIIENIPIKDSSNSALTVREKKPVSKEENENELNEDELAAALFEGMYRTFLVVLLSKKAKILIRGHVGKPDLTKLLNLQMMTMIMKTLSQ